MGNVPISEDNFQLASRAIDVINEKLKEYQKQLKKLQPKKHGSVQLELHNCGKKCRGCPHAVWKKWKGKKGREEKPLWLAHKVNNPEQSLRKTGEFEEVYEDSIELIRKIKYLLEVKADLLQHHKKIGALLRRIK